MELKLKLFLSLFLVCLVIGKNPFIIQNENENLFAVNQEDIDEINKTGLWTPSSISENLFKGWTIKQVKRLCGLRFNKMDKLISSTESRCEEKSSIFNQLPLSFDGRTSWGKCLGPVKDQGNCGSCWAFTAAGKLGDMICLKNNLTSYVQLSQQDLVSCDSLDNGCGGGTYSNAFSFSYLTKTGIVTDSCIPYTSGIDAVVQNAGLNVKILMKVGSNINVIRYIIIMDLKYIA